MIDIPVCPICLSELFNDLTASTCCRNVFHYNCCIAYFIKSVNFCPLCKKENFKNNIIKLNYTIEDLRQSKSYDLMINFDKITKLLEEDNDINQLSEKLDFSIGDRNIMNLCRKQQKIIKHLINEKANLGKENIQLKENLSKTKSNEQKFQKDAREIRFKYNTISQEAESMKIQIKSLL